MGHPRLHLKIVLLELEEYRYQNGWGNNGKRGSVRCDRIPISFLGEVSVSCRNDDMNFLPEGLKSPFTTADFRKAAVIPPKATQNTVNLLYRLGLIQRVGKQGRCFLYEITTEKEET